MRQKYQISFSGGRTSAYMTKLLLDNFSDKYDFIVTFSNTGKEDERTLEFVDNCDKYFGFNTVWLEAVIDPLKGSRTTHKIVDFKTACRDNSIFESMIEKYGIPNKSYPHCNRELKLQVMDSYLLSLGIKPKEIPTALGIRMDEPKRISKSHVDRNIHYPLVDLFPSDKEDVLIFWENQDFDLGLKDYEGNCKLCFKKSFKKLIMQINDSPEEINFHKEMEEKHARTNCKEGYPDRVFFRMNTSAIELERMASENQERDNSYTVEDSECSESCEVFGA